MTSSSDISPVNRSADPQRSPVKQLKRVTLETPPSPSPKKANPGDILVGVGMKRKARRSSEELE